MRKILFLEDDVVLAESVIDFLEDEGYVITHAKDGLEALAFCEKNQYSLYILDVNVPLLNGFELLALLRKHGNETPAFFLTALTDIESMGKGFDLGADDYIKKPFDPEELLLRIQRKLKSSERHVQEVATLTDELNVVTKESQEDFLTKVANRRSLDAKLLEFEAEYTRLNRDFSLVFIDIDLFKRINDDYGHDVGDSVLEQFADILQSNSREVDYLARYGGEEFILLLPESSIDSSTRFAEKLRLKIQSHEFSCNDHKIKLTLSAGIAIRSDVGSVEALVKQADAYVYKAKQSGRNKVITC